MSGDNGRMKRTIEIDITLMPALVDALRLASATALFYGEKGREAQVALRALREDVEQKLASDEERVHDLTPYFSAYDILNIGVELLKAKHARVEWRGVSWQKGWKSTGHVYVVFDTGRTVCTERYVEADSYYQPKPASDAKTAIAAALTAVAPCDVIVEIGEDVK